MTQANEVSLFLSYNAGDKEHVRKLAAALSLAGARVWFDEWIVRPGDSIPGAINQGLAEFSIFALVWSVRAAQSNWVKAEMDAAVARWIKDDQVKLVPVRLDQTPIPTLLAPIRYVDANDGDQMRVARELLGMNSEAEYRIAVQSFIFEAGLRFAEYPGVGVLVACPRCGATVESIETWEAVDERHDDLYVGARCKLCGWNDGSEV